MENASYQATTKNALVRTFTVSQGNFLPLAVTSFILTLPFAAARVRQINDTLVAYLSYDLAVVLYCTITGAVGTIAFYGAIASARGQQVGIRECLAEGLAFAPRAILPGALSGFAVGVAFVVHTSVAAVALAYLPMWSLIAAVERRGTIHAARRMLAIALRHPWLLFGAATILSLPDLILYQLSISHRQFYASAIGELVTLVATSTELFVDVLSINCMVVLYVIVRHNDDGLTEQQSLPELRQIIA